MNRQRVNTSALNEALSRYGSLQEATTCLERAKKSLEDEVGRLGRGKAALEREMAARRAAAKTLGAQKAQQRQALEQLQARVKKSGRQWDLFEGFIGMVLTSPSTQARLTDLIAILQRLENEGWSTTRTTDELRTLFVCTLLGNHLRCYRCRRCGANFIVNREPYYSHYDSNYHCPACHTSLHVEADDSFLQAMLSPEGIKEVSILEELERQVERQKPLEVFLDIPCFICGKPPANNWSREQAVDTFKKSRWAHQPCWGTPAGQVAQMGELVKRVRDLQR